jgi:hypothetical protein
MSGEGDVEGLLLYPLSEPVDVSLRIKGQRVRVRTIDFAAGWPAIKAQMLGLLDEGPLVKDRAPAGSL